MKSEMKRKGFTLVELLIVIVVIGILSAMMMLSSTEAVTSAKASNIVSNLRNLKTAALAFYTDSMDYFADSANAKASFGDKNSSIQTQIRSYLSDGNNAPDIADYRVVNSDKNENTWWVVYEITGSTSEQNAIKKKLAGRAKSLGLKGSNDTKDAVDQNVKNTPYTNQKCVALQVH